MTAHQVVQSVHRLLECLPYCACISNLPGRSFTLGARSSTATRCYSIASCHSRIEHTAHLHTPVHMPHHNLMKQQVCKHAFLTNIVFSAAVYEAPGPSAHASTPCQWHAMVMPQSWHHLKAADHVQDTLSQVLMTSQGAFLQQDPV